MQTDYLRILLERYYPLYFFALFRAHELYNVKPFIDRLESPILDLGCGDGLIAEILFQRQLEYGVDLSQEAIDAAKASNTYEQVFCIDAHEIPLPDASVGGIYSNCVLEHIPDMPGLLREVGRLLRPGAYFVATCLSPSYYGLNPVYRALDNPLMRPLRGAMINAENKLHTHVSVFDKDMYWQMLGDVGLKLEHHQFYAPSNLVNEWAKWDTLSKYRLPIPTRLTHYGLLVYYLKFQKRFRDREAHLQAQYDRLHEVCYQRPPAVDMPIGAAQILVAKKA